MALSVLGKAVHECRESFLPVARDIKK
jgi:hypothetical protein